MYKKAEIKTRTMRSFLFLCKYSIYFLGILFFVVACTSQRKADDFVRTHHNKKIVKYTYRGKPYVAALDIAVNLRNNQVDESLVMVENELSEIALGKGIYYYVNVDIGETIFSNTRHHKKFELILDPHATVLPDYFSWNELIVRDDKKLIQLELDTRQITEPVEGALAFHFYIDDGERFRVSTQKEIVLKYPYQIMPPKDNPAEREVLTILTTGIEEVIVPVFTLQGSIYDHQTGMPIDNVSLKLKPDCPDIETLLLVSEADGSFSFPMAKDCCFALTASKSGYVEHKAKNLCTNELNDSHNFTTTLAMERVTMSPYPGNKKNDRVEEAEYVAEEIERVPAGTSFGGEVGTTWEEIPTEVVFEEEVEAVEEWESFPAEGTVDPVWQPNGSEENEASEEEAISEVSAAETAAWEQVLVDPSIMKFRDYASGFPDGHYMEDAKEMLQEMDEEDLIEDLEGSMFYHVKDTMAYGVDELVSMGISANELLEKDEFVIKGLSGSVKSAEVEKKDIEIGLRMKASLIDPSGNKFKITPLEKNEERELDFLNKEQLSLWQWNVMPLTEEQGKHRLQFAVSKVKEGLSDPIPVKVVDVFVIVKQSFWQRNKTALLLSGFLLGCLAFGYFFYKKRKVEEDIRLHLPREKLYGMIRENKTSAALGLLHQSLKDKHRGFYRELLAIAARNKDWNQKNVGGIVDTETLTRQKNSINKDLIQFVAKITKDV